MAIRYLEVLIFYILSGCGQTGFVEPSPPAEKPKPEKIIPCENVETIFGWTSVCFDSDTGKYTCKPDTTLEINK